MEEIRFENRQKTLRLFNICKMIMNKGVLELKDIKIFARHGCFEEEREIGNWFIVDFSAGYGDSVKSSGECCI